MFKFNSEIPNIKTSIFPTISRLAQKNNAINLAQGFPGFSADQSLLNLITHYTNKGYNQYAHHTGYINLKEKLSQKILEEHDKFYHPEEEITITAGATQGIYSALSATINKGDEVIIIEPAFDCYEPAILLNGGVPVRSQLKAKSFEIDWQDIEQKINSKTKVILINTPHNPTGKIWNQKDIDSLIKLTRNTDIIILSDEVYEHIIFDDKKHLSICKFPELSERAYIVYSFGKTFHITGWRAGYIVAPKKLMQVFVKCHQYQVYAVNTPIQFALSDYIENTSTYLKVNNLFEQKRSLFLEHIKNSRFKTLATEGTYFMLMDYSNISQESDIDFSRRITEQNKVATIPTSVFYKNPPKQQIIRICFAKSDSEIINGAKNLSEL